MQIPSPSAQDALAAMRAVVGETACVIKPTEASDPSPWSKLLDFLQ
ncbi:MAG: hypothetical protein ABI606_21660 [Rhodoferax sp.]